MNNLPCTCQEWFSSHTSPHKNLTFSGGSLPNTGPEPGLPSGQQTSTLEEVVILRNGTVLHGQKGADPNGGWPGAEAAGRYVSRVQLGPMSEIQDTAVSGGVVYVPNGRGQLLILRPKTSSGLGASWQVLSLCLCLSVSVSLYLSLSVSVSLCVSVSISISLSLSV